MELVIGHVGHFFKGKGGFGVRRRLHRVTQAGLEAVNTFICAAVCVLPHGETFLNVVGPLSNVVQIDNLVHRVGGGLQRAVIVRVEAQGGDPCRLRQRGVGVRLEAAALPPVVGGDAAGGGVGVAQKDVLQLLCQVGRALGREGVDGVGPAARSIGDGVKHRLLQGRLRLVGIRDAVDFRAELEAFHSGRVQLLQRVESKRDRRVAHAVLRPVGVGQQVHDVADALGRAGDVRLGNPPVVAFYIAAPVLDRIRAGNGLVHQLGGVEEEVLELIDVQGVRSAGLEQLAGDRVFKVGFVGDVAQNLHGGFQGVLELGLAGEAAARRGAADVDLVVDGVDALGDQLVQLGGIGVATRAPLAHRVHQLFIGQLRQTAVAPPIIGGGEDGGGVRVCAGDEGVLDLLPRNGVPVLGEVVMILQDPQRLYPLVLEFLYVGKGVVVLVGLRFAEPAHVGRRVRGGGPLVADHVLNRVGQVDVGHAVQRVGHGVGHHQHTGFDPVLPCVHRPRAAVPPPIGLARGGVCPGDDDLLNLLLGQLLHVVLTEVCRRQFVVDRFQRVVHLLTGLKRPAVLVLAELVQVAVQQGRSAVLQVVQGILRRVLIPCLVLGLVHGHEDVAQIGDVHLHFRGTLVQTTPRETSALILRPQHAGRPVARSGVNAGHRAIRLHAHQDVPLDLVPAQRHISCFRVDGDPVFVEPRHKILEIGGNSTVVTPCKFRSCHIRAQIQIINRILCDMY